MDPLLGTRLGFVVLCIGAAAVLIWKFERAVRVVRAFFLEPTLPINLGLLRAITFGTVFLDAVSSRPDLFAGLPASFLKLPQGWSWLGDFVPISVDGVIWADRALLVSAAFATLGVFTRPATVVAALLSVYVIGIPNFYFKVGHGSHVTVLSALVLATSRSGDGFSVDALIRWLRGKRAFPAHEAYTVPVRFCWLLLGTMYLFPGLWKLWEGGDLWLSGVKLKVELFHKWRTMPEFFPPFRLDKYPALLALLGTFTLIFEIGFFFALFKRATRVIAAFAAACFHVGVWLNMNIWFHPFHPLIVLLDLPGILPARVANLFNGMASWLDTHVRSRVPARFRSEALEEQLPRRSIGASFVVGSTLVFAMFIAGFSPIDSWPIAVYPRFSTRRDKVAESSSALCFKIATRDGVEHALQSPLKDLGDSVTYGIVRNVLHPKRRGSRRELRRHLALFAHLLRTEGIHFEPGARLLVYRYDFAVDPDKRSKAPPELSLVAETEL